MRSLAIVLVLLVISSSRVDAENDTRNVLIGPVLGIRLGGHDGPRGVFGVEGGVGIGPQRLNLGVEHRDGKLFSYIEIDPWFVLGGSVGVGIDSDGEAAPVLGLWEGIMFKPYGCSDRYETAVTMAAGYRYTGVHELYVTVKAGESQPVCFNLR